LTLSGAARAQTRQYVAESDVVYSAITTAQGEEGKVIVTDLKTRETREIYRPAAGQLFEMKVAPRTNYLAVRERVRQFEGMRVTLERMTLHLLGPDGVELDAIDKVRDYSWSPDGRYLAYVTGDVVKKDSPFQNAVAWMLDIANRRRSKVTDNGYVVRWASFDGRLYIRKWDYTKNTLDDVVAYDPSTESLSVTGHHSMWFSPSGSYYYDPGPRLGQGRRQNVYAAASDAVLESKFISRLAYWSPIEWAPDSDLLLLSGAERRPDARNGAGPLSTFVFDPKADSASSLSIEPDQVVGWGDSAATILVETGGGISKQRVGQSSQAPPR
jgi:hypothetical protein